MGVICGMFSGKSQKIKSFARKVHLIVNILQKVFWFYSKHSQAFKNAMQKLPAQIYMNGIEIMIIGDPVLR